jgi:hypothetical protein
MRLSSSLHCGVITPFDVLACRIEHTCRRAINRLRRGSAQQVVKQGRRWACWHSTAMWRWAGASSHLATRCPGLIAPERSQCYAPADHAV